MSRASMFSGDLRGLPALAIALCLSLIPASRAETPAAPPEPAAGDAAGASTFTLWPKWGPFLDLEGKVGTRRNIGEATLFVPLWQDERSMLFGDFRFKADDQDSHEGNFGVGFRRMLGEGWNAGLYGFFDRRHSPNANLFNQLTFGAELLGTNFDFRANTYWPVGSVVQTVGAPTSTGSSTATATVTPGGTLQISVPGMSQAYEYALRGFDAEAGVRIPIAPAGSPYNLRFYAGGFRFDEATGASQVVAGPRLRLEFTDYDVAGLWGGTRFTVSGEWQTDQVRGSQFFAGLRLRVPLQAEKRRASFTMQERRMTDAIVRDVDIVANTQSTEISSASVETASATSGGQAIVALNSATTSGASLQTAITNAGANSTVVLQGNFNSGGATTTLQTGQSLIGGGSISVRTSSGRTVTANLAGSASLTANTGGSNFSVLMANNSTLQGMTIYNTATTGNNALAVGVSGRSNVQIIGNTINATVAAGPGSAQGIQIRLGSTNVTISGNSVVAEAPGNGPVYGIQASTSSRNVITSGNRVVATGQSPQGVSGIYYTGVNTFGTIGGNSVTASGSGNAANINGIEISSNATATVSGNSATVSADMTRTSGSGTGSITANGVLVNSGGTATVTDNSFSVSANVANSSTSSGALTVTANGLRVGGTSAATLTASGNSFSGISASGTTNAGSGLTTTASGANVSNSSMATLSGNRFTASSSGSSSGGGTVTVGSNGILASTGTVTASGNSQSLTSGGTSSAANLTGATIGSGSTGNVTNTGVCTSGGGNTGTLAFTNGLNCP